MAPKSKPSQEVKIDEVFYYIPNIIGYTRILLVGISLYYMKGNPLVFAISYMISCALDALDGFAARYFNQCSKFGAVLDMVTDRCTTTCLLCYLAAVYEPYSIFFQFLISLDISSHYMHMYSSLTSGATSHKQVDENQNFLLRAYYHNKVVLFLVCGFNELFFVGLYLMHEDQYSAYNYLYYWLTCSMAPFFIFKNVLNVIQFMEASKSLARVDVIERSKKN
ncbi:CDP-diacylglycerol-inositol 3-phosphatidyltransferase [Neoconidiobolus thromboides FSU 785]|nr:CDP-diacylglycerol-inositol 3-phosphatidyltransferase [Neoconidiobolus thromboides FSU 785]